MTIIMTLVVCLIGQPECKSVHLIPENPLLASIQACQAASQVEAAKYAAAHDGWKVVKIVCGPPENET